METERYQKELFEFESPKKPVARFSGIFPRTDFAIVLTPERIVFASIGIIMLIVVFFALGVEKGRSIAYTKFTETRAAAKNMVTAYSIPVKPSQAPVVVASKRAPITNITPKTGLPAAVKTQTAFDSKGSYTVVAATFLREDFALREAARLKKAGLESFVYYGEPYYLACVGSFQSKSMAQNILNKVRQMHRDAYVRLR